MHFQPHRGSKTIHSAAHEVHGETVVAFVRASTAPGRSVPDKGAALARAHDVMADLHSGGERLAAGATVVPVEFAEHELTHCPYSSDWLCAVVVGGEGIMLRVAADNLDHARVKLGTMIRHLHDGDTHTNATARVAALAAKNAPAPGTEPAP